MTIRSVAFHAKETTRQDWEEFEDAAIDKERFDDLKVKFISGKELRRRLGL
jgi:hypothetical protein